MNAETKNFPRVDNCGSGIEVHGALTDHELEIVENQMLFSESWCGVHRRMIRISCFSGGVIRQVRAVCREFDCPYYRETK